MEDWQNAGFGIYIHWPFCMHKCPYCDFNSHVSRDIDQKRWRDAMLSDLQHSHAETSDRTVDTIFFGGGTPSLMPPETVSAILQEINALWTVSPNVEISLEANPTSVESGRFAAYSDAGINRISMGIQSLRDDDLRALGRMHSVTEAKAAFDIARKHFDRVSFDLIYARQGQTLDQWADELEEAINMAVDHLSLYQLTIENGTRFGELYDRGKLRNLPSDDLAADMYFKTQEICAKHGLPAYEISNHAHEQAESQHNLIYWRYGDYIGVGPGAHGRVTFSGKKLATDTYKSPEKWLETVEKHGSGRKSTEIISNIDQASEYLMMSMRLSEGTDLKRYTSLSGEEVDQKILISLENEGFIIRKADRIVTTDKGRPVLNAVLREILAG